MPSEFTPDPNMRPSGRSDSPGLTPDSTARRRGGGGRRRPDSAKSSSIAVNLVLAVLVAGLMVAGWFLANQHQLLVAEQAAREAAEQRLAVLEDRLRVTDEALTETGADTGKQINRWESEIRKLWAVANERNKKWIKANETGLAAQTKGLESARSAQKQLVTQLAAIEKSVAKLADINVSVKRLDTKVGEIGATQKELVGRVNSARQAVASLQAGLVNRVEENEQAVASMDAFRGQLNQRLTRLEQSLNTAPGPASR